LEAALILLDGAVSDYVGFDVTNPLGERPVTVEDLLTHRSGLGGNAAYVYFKDFPAGFLRTIPRDHIKVLLAYLNGGEHNYRLLAPATVRDMLTPRVEFDGRGSLGGGPTMVGLGWMLGNLGQPTEWFGHGGAHMWGWVNDYRAYPKLDLAIAVSTNRWGRISDTSTPAHLHPRVLIAEIAAEFLAGRRSGAAMSWAWKRAYAVGLSFALEASWRLGMQEAITPEMVGSMIAGADGGPGATLDAGRLSRRDRRPGGARAIAREPRGVPPLRRMPAHRRRAQRRLGGRRWSGRVPAGRPGRPPNGRDR
jgi:hypothetical protein